MTTNKKCFPAHITKLLEKKGYYDLTTEQRVENHKKTLNNLAQVPHFNYEAGREAIKELRGR
ncbi:hypothetical protein [Bacillus cereus]|uniref:hypothetical protein n=1 Tax=Bacillus cereus TaxID=1396 RepID=UPI000BFB7EA7|nr:hypothetical protein [Bacillus cereus]PGL32165.1 hypothetical protein CN913_27820 [Bacillus cereus]